MNRRHALGFAGAGVAAALVPAAAAKVSRLPELIEAHKAAWKAFGDAIDAQWEAEGLAKSNGDASFLPFAQADWDRTNEAEQEALLAVLIYRPVSAEDARAKVDYIGALNRSGSLADFSFDALLESVLPEGEFLTDKHTKWKLHNGGAS